MSIDYTGLERARVALREAIPEAIKLRHELHANPELSGDERQTAKVVLDALEAANTESIQGGYLVRFGGEGAAVGIRAELDALPIRETTGLEWASRLEAMHACGHDVHMAALVAAARALAAAGVSTPFVAVLQPREEAVPSGAADIVASEQFRAADVGAMLGVHVQPRLASGTFSALAGVVNASSDDFSVTLRAQGGHAGYPHVAGDPIVAAAEIVTRTQSLISRRTDPVNPSVVTFGSIHAGTAPNVIPRRLTLDGTIRAFDEDERAMLISQVEQIAASSADVHGCALDYRLMRGEPALRNDVALARLTAEALTASTGSRNVDLRSCGSDDFSYYGEYCPSLMVFYGVGDAAASSPGLHHPSFAPPVSDVLGVAECMLVGFFAAASYLSNRGSS